MGVFFRDFKTLRTRKFSTGKIKAYSVYNIYIVFPVYTVYSVQTALQYLNSSMYAYILLGKVRTVLEWADGLLSKMFDGLDWVSGGDTP